MTTVRKAFVQTCEKTMQLRSKEGKCEYTVSIQWTTPEFLEYSDRMQRDEKISKIKH